jgi:hypothetical protein
LIVFQKANDTVNREKLWRIFDCKCSNNSVGTLALLIVKVKMYQQPFMIIGNNYFSADPGVVEVGIQWLMLFNVYLEEEQGITDKLSEIVRRDDH